MKSLFTIAMMFHLGIAALCAQQPVRMSFSGSFIPTGINQQPNTITDDETFAGMGTFGSFTFRGLRTDATAPQASPSCAGPMRVNIPVVAGGGVFRFQDGSLLTVKVAEGSLCIDLAIAEGKLTSSYQVTGGTGRFKGASGALTLNGTVTPVMYDASNSAALLLAISGEFSGSLSQ